MIDYFLTRYFGNAVRSTMHLDPAGGPMEPTAGGHKRPLLYVHIPFCFSLCPFCMFHRVRYSEPRVVAYFDALRREIGQYHELGFHFEEVYVGGGTPTSNPAELAATLDLIQNLWSIERISVESNPRELTPELTRLLGSIGVNRLSVGVQSFDDELLKGMGRYDAYGSGDEIVRRLEHVRDKLDTVNVDMIFNLPGQTELSLQKDMDILTGTLGVDQVSFYPLMVNSSSQRSMKGAMGGGPGNNEKHFYYTILDALQPCYSTSSAWCFSRDGGQIDEYIVDHHDYLGVGSGAFSYLDGVLYSSTFSIAGYIDRVRLGLAGITASRALSPTERLRHDFLLGLFGTVLNRSEMARRHPGFETELRWEIMALQLLGAISKTPVAYRLTRSGMYSWVIMMREFFNAVNALRTDMRGRIRAERALLNPPHRAPVHG